MEQFKWILKESLQRNGAELQLKGGALIQLWDVAGGLLPFPVQKPAPGAWIESLVVGLFSPESVQAFQSGALVEGSLTIPQVGTLALLAVPSGRVDPGQGDGRGGIGGIAGVAGTGAVLLCVFFPPQADFLKQKRVAQWQGASGPEEVVPGFSVAAVAAASAVAAAPVKPVSKGTSFTLGDIPLEDLFALPHSSSHPSPPPVEPEIPSLTRAYGEQHSFSLQGVLDPSLLPEGLSKKLPEGLSKKLPEGLSKKLPEELHKKKTSFFEAIDPVEASGQGLEKDFFLRQELSPEQMAYQHSQGQAFHEKLSFDVATLEERGALKKTLSPVLGAVTDAAMDMDAVQNSPAPPTAPEGGLSIYEVLQLGEALQEALHEAEQWTGLPPATLIQHWILQGLESYAKTRASLVPWHPPSRPNPR